MPETAVASELVSPNTHARTIDVTTAARLLAVAQRANYLTLVVAGSVTLAHIVRTFEAPEPLLVLWSIGVFGYCAWISWMNALVAGVPVHPRSWLVPVLFAVGTLPLFAAVWPRMLSTEASSLEVQGLFLSVVTLAWSWSGLVASVLLRRLRVGHLDLAVDTLLRRTLVPIRPRPSRLLVSGRKRWLAALWLTVGLAWMAVLNVALKRFACATRSPQRNSRCTCRFSCGARQTNREGHCESAVHRCSSSPYG